MIPEKQSETGRIFCCFEPFFALSPPAKKENLNFEIEKKTPGNIINLNMCNINDYHMMYGS